MKRSPSLWFLLCAACFLTLSLHAEGPWLDNYNQALAQAKSENKLVLADFTGSDWCPWCIRLDKEVYDTSAFQSFAKKHLVLLKLDFPQTKQLSASVKAQNDQLQQQFGVQGFPTTVLLNGEGKEVARNEGYMEGGPSAMITWIRKNGKLPVSEASQQ
jgi:protein disulfide-isomerase